MSAPGRNVRRPWPASAAEEAVMDAAEAAFLADYGTGPGAPVSVVIAAFNEEPSVAGVIEAVPPNVAGRPTECLVVDDGSGDSTASEARRAGALLCRLDQNLGQGRALQVGYSLAAARHAEVIVTMDADGQFDPSQLRRLVQPVIDGRADFVNGSRRLNKENRRGDPVRRAGIVVFGTVLSLLTGTRVTDPANGFRAFRPEVPRTVPLRQPQYQTAEMLIGALAAGFSVVEVPVTVRPRLAGKSKKGSNLRYGLRFARVVLTSWWAARGANRSRRGRRHRPGPDR